MLNPGVTIGGYAAALVLGWLWLGARDDVAAAIESCNTDKMRAISEAERITRETERAASDREILQLRQIISDAEKAREIAIRAAREAESRPVRVQEVVRRVADRDACIDLSLPDELVRSLRD